MSKVKKKKKQLCRCARCGKKKYCVPDKEFCSIKTSVEELLTCEGCFHPVRDDLLACYDRQDYLDEEFVSELYIESLERQQGFPEYKDAQSHRLCAQEFECDAYI